MVSMFHELHACNKMGGLVTSPPLRHLGLGDAPEQAPEEQAPHDNASDGQTGRHRATERRSDRGADFAESVREIGQVDGCELHF